MTKECVYSVGCDPELFLVDSNGAFKSAHNIVPGTKENPEQVFKGAVQADGTAAEFNIDPALDAEEFSRNIKSVLIGLKEIVEKANKGYSLIVAPTAQYDPKYFKNIPKRAKLLGCEPDHNVYTGTFNPKPDGSVTFRTGGGHIHLGWTVGENPNDGSHMYDCREMTKQLDAVLYPMSLLWDSDNERRKLYGKIGTFRPKHYGVEYRPLSNAWVADPDLHIWIFEATKHVAKMLDEEAETLWQDPYCISIKQSIDKDDIPTKRELISYHDYLYEEFNVPLLPKHYVDPARK